MPAAYDPLNFWGVLFSFRAGMVGMIPRSLLLLPFAIGAASLEQWSVPEDRSAVYGAFDSVTGPFTVLVGLLTSFRVNDAYNKWKGAARAVDMLHAFSKEVITRLCAYCEPTPENQASIAEIRRLIVLGCVLLQKHVRSNDNFDQELKTGLLKAEEHQQLTKDKWTICITSGKKDRFPSRNRPAFAYFKVHQNTMAMARRKAFLAPPYHTGVDGAVVKMNAVFDDVENLARTQIPLPYAQIARFVSFLFLALLPFALATKLKWLVIPTSFLANVVYFTIDECAGEMETPFGPDENDVDVDKLTRRIDKHTAAIVGLWAGQPAINYDVFPDASSQSASRLGRSDSLYNLGPKSSRSSSSSSLIDFKSGGKMPSVALEAVQVEFAATVPAAEKPREQVNDTADQKPTEASTNGEGEEAKSDDDDDADADDGGDDGGGDE